MSNFRSVWLASGILHWLQNKSDCIGLGENIPTFHPMYYSEIMDSTQSL